MEDKEPFLARWSRRKLEAKADQRADAQEAAALPAAAAPPEPAAAPVQAELEASTTPEYREYFDPKVDEALRRVALKKLFSDPHYNVMDGLDTYIDDYSKPDPLPASIARQLAQSAFLGFVEPKPSQTTPEPSAAAGQPAAAPDSPQTLTLAEATRERCEANPETDENADLRLQSHDAAGCGGAENSAAADGPGQL